MNTFLHQVGLTFNVLGEILIGLTVLRVHWRFRKEHRVDEKVFQEMKREQVLGIIGIIFIVIGYLLQLFFNI